MSNVFNVDGLIAEKAKHLAKKGINFNIIVAGSNGLGKTSFLRNLLGIPTLSENPFLARAGSQHWQNEDACNIQTSTVSLTKQGLQVDVRLVEISNIGDSLGGYGFQDPLEEVIKKEFREYEQQARKQVPSLFQDKRIHVCFYFISPCEKISVSDIEAMRIICKLCSLVPIVAKADLLNSESAKSISALMRRQFEQHGIVCFEDPEAGCTAPFFVANGQIENGIATNRRVYPWGTADLGEMKHNDFVKLKDFILGHAFARLVNETSVHYKNYRTDRMAQKLVQDSEKGGDRRVLKRMEEQKKEIFAMRERIKSKRQAYLAYITENHKN